MGTYQPISYQGVYTICLAISLSLYLVYFGIQKVCLDVYTVYDFLDFLSDNVDYKSKTVYFHTHSLCSSIWLLNFFSLLKVSKLNNLQFFDTFAWFQMLSIDVKNDCPITHYYQKKFSTAKVPKEYMTDIKKRFIFFEIIRDSLFQETIFFKV